MQIFVLGMHRSGTSALARTLGLLGCHAGEPADFPAADAANPRGYWERRDVWRLNEDLLATLGTTWDGAASFAPGELLEALPAADLAAYTERAREVVGALDRAAGGRPWVVKDPRLCLLLPIWRRVVERPVCVLIERSPLSIARSLRARDRFPLALGIALWERYLRSALTASSGLPRLRVRYEDLIDRPRATAGRLRHELEALDGSDRSALSEPAPGALEAFLDPALERHRREPEAESDLLTPPQRQLLDALTLDPLSDGGELSLGARDLLDRHAERSRQEIARRVEIETLHARLALSHVNALSERAAFEAELARVKESAEAERSARLEWERNAAQAIAAEREARERAEAYAGEVAELARTLQEKIAQDVATFDLEHAERLRLEAALAAR